MRCRPQNRAFTLVELLVSVTIVIVLATIVLYGMASMQTLAKTQRTKATIAKLHELIAEKWEALEFRSVSPNATWFLSTANPGHYQFTPLDPVAEVRLNAIRELMKFELPDRMTDVLDDTLLFASTAPDGTPTTVTGIPWPGSNLDYRALQKWSTTPGPGLAAAYNAGNNVLNTTHQGAECLYLIISRMEVDDASALEMFADTEIGDVDGDGMFEILDAWGNPIEFLRWAPGFASPMHVGEDAFDYALADVKNNDGVDLNNDGSDVDTHRLFPLIFSAGPDGEYNISVGFGFALDYRLSPRPDGTIYPNDPFVFEMVDGAPKYLGAADDPSQQGHIDNITNHILQTNID